jgi:hypothetical protein
LCLPRGEAVPSSTSNSDRTPRNRDRYARQTAADRPGVAQPVPVRPVPERPWGAILVGAVALFVLLVAGWESYWRISGATPGMRNTYGLWAIQRRRIDQRDGDATVVLGGSRAYYDIQLPAWEHLAGRRPIQLSFEATSPLRYLEDLAADPKFTGRALVVVEPSLFFSGLETFGGGVYYYYTETSSQLIGQQLSMRLVEPYFAFDDPDYALQVILARQPWPARPGRKWLHDLRKLATHEPDRDAYLWGKVEADPAYLALVRGLLLQTLEPSRDDPSPAQALAAENEQIGRAVKAVAQLKARGAQVLFVRLPSSGAYLAYENSKFPRARTWDVLLAATGAPGIHFEDYPELQGYELPDSSHMTRSDAERFTVSLYRIIARDFPDRRANAAEPGGQQIW